MKFLNSTAVHNAKTGACQCQCQIRQLSNRFRNHNKLFLKSINFSKFPVGVYGEKEDVVTLVVAFE
jgi:hypothetical protein